MLKSRFLRVWEPYSNSFTLSSSKLYLFLRNSFLTLVLLFRIDSQCQELEQLLLNLLQGMHDLNELFALGEG